MWPRYRRKRTNTEVRRASQTHQAPQVGFPHRLPVAKQTAVNPAPTGPISAAARSASGWRQISDRMLQPASEKEPAEASQANGTCTYMMRTVSPCCQSSGAKNSPQVRLAAVSSAPGQNSQGRTLPDSRRNWPGLAKRCSVFPERGGATDKRAFTNVLYLIDPGRESISP